MFKHVNGGTIFHKQFLVCDVIWDRLYGFKITPEFIYQGSYRLEKYLNIQDCLEKSLKIQFALKNT